MAEQKIELRKVRDLSQNLNDTFQFIKQNFKPLVASFFAIAGIFMLSNAIVSGVYQGTMMGGMFKEIFSGGGNILQTYEAFSGTYPLLAILTWLNMTAMQVSIIAYFKVYEIKQEGLPGIEEVWDVFKSYYFKVLFYSIPIYLAIIIGFMFCFLPGIYLAVVFVPFPIILMEENQTFSGAYSRCFAIIKNNFWSSFGVYVLVYLICWFSGGIISLFFSAITGLISYVTTNNINTTLGIATSVLSAFSFVFYIIYYVAVNLHYFNLTEKHDGTGLLQRLDKLGKSGNDFNNIQEQY